MKHLLAIALLASAAAHAQTPAELDDYYAKKALADAANQVVVRANADAVTQIRTLVTDQQARIAAIEGKVDSALATLKELQARPDATVKQVIDALVLKLSAP
jgi:hypothetical protein